MCRASTHAVRIAVFVTSIAIAGRWSAHAQAPQFAVTLTATGAVVSGVPAHEQVALFGATRTVGGFGATVGSYSAVQSDADGDGSVTFDVEGGPPERSLWLAVLTSTGRYTLGVPPDFEVSPYALNKTSFLGTHVKIGVPFGYMFLVRPGSAAGSGAWSAREGDNGNDDLDKVVAGVVDIDLRSLEPTGASPAPPDQFQPGDVLFVVNPRDFRYSITVIQ